MRSSIFEPKRRHYRRGLSFAVSPPPESRLAPHATNNGALFYFPRPPQMHASCFTRGDETKSNREASHRENNAGAASGYINSPSPLVAVAPTTTTIATTESTRLLSLAPVHDNCGTTFKALLKQEIDKVTS